MMNVLYPRLYKLDYTSSTWGWSAEEEEEGSVKLPDRLPLSGSSLSHEHLFLMTGPFG